MSKEAQKAQQQAEKDYQNFKVEPVSKKLKKEEIIQPVVKQDKTEDVDLKPALKAIKDATGLSDIKEILLKIERHS